MQQMSTMPCCGYAIAPAFNMFTFSAGWCSTTFLQKTFRKITRQIRIQRQLLSHQLIDLLQQVGGDYIQSCAPLRFGIGRNFGEMNRLQQGRLQVNERQVLN
jgi:hypothetical protein